MIAVVDTCVWVSALINPKGFPARIVEHLQRGDFVSATSKGILYELNAVLHRPRIRTKYGLIPEAISLHVRKIESHSVLVSPGAPLKLCRDPWDDHILAAAQAAKADYLVSRDDDLKGDPELVRSCATLGIQIVSLRNFLLALSR